jgi:hypothetical protein
MSARGTALVRAGGDHTGVPGVPCSSEPCPPARLVCVLAILHAMFLLSLGWIQPTLWHTLCVVYVCPVYPNRQVLPFAIS